MRKNKRNIEIYICLDNLRSLYNIGAIFRTCSFFGIYNIILLGYSGKNYDDKGTPFLHKEIFKTSLGSENHMKLTFLGEPAELEKFAKDMDLEIISVEQNKNSTELSEWKPEKSCILIFGNEKEGVRSEIIRFSDYVLNISRYGKHNSLNVTTSAGIVLYHISRTI